MFDNMRVLYSIPKLTVYMCSRNCSVSFPKRVSVCRSLCCFLELVSMTVYANGPMTWGQAAGMQGAVLVDHTAAQGSDRN